MEESKLEDEEGGEEKERQTPSIPMSFHKTLSIRNFEANTREDSGTSHTTSDEEILGVMENYGR
jgi:hypothetical protein